MLRLYNDTQTDSVSLMILQTLLFEDYLWKLDCPRKLNRLIVLWRPLPQVIRNVIRDSLCQMVCTLKRCIVISSQNCFPKDHPYILAFSLIMLHTDAFNRSNKRKMSKADYIKNTKLVGVPTEVLDVRKIHISSVLIYTNCPPFKVFF